MTKNAFYLTVNAFFVLKLFKLLSWFLVKKISNFIKKIKLISKFMTSQPGKKIIAIHILPNFSGRKDNQIRKFGQLIEYNMRNIFLEKSSTKCGGDTILRPFSNLWINSLFYQCQVEGFRNVLKLSCRPLTFNPIKLF